MENSRKIKTYTPEETEKIVLSHINMDRDKKSTLKRLGEEILPYYFNGNEKEKKVAEEKIDKELMSLVRLFDSKTHVSLMETFEERYRSVSAEMTDTMIEEFKCSNESEKALVTLIVNAYIRVMDNSRRLNDELECKNITPNRNAYIANLSKQIDRAHRQFTTSLLTLKQLKAPKIEMSIKAHTAFIANNQQVNVDNKKNEIIEP